MQRGGGGKWLKISELCILNEFSISPESYPNQEFIYVDIEAIENGTGKYSLDKKILGAGAPSRARRLADAGSTIISTVRPYLKGFAYIKDKIENCIFSTGFAILRSKNESILLNKMIYYTFMYSNRLMSQMEEAMPKGQYPSINNNDIENFMFFVPPLDQQQAIVAQINEYERIIVDLEDQMVQTTKRKQAILVQYL